MVSIRNGSGKNGAGRAPTPTSPSPSPEPTGNPATSTPAASITTPNPFLPTHGTSNGLDGLSGSQRDGQVPFHELLRLEQDPNEPARQHVEDKTRNVIDSLYQLAVCAADVQPGREDIVGVKVNDLVSHLASLTSSAAANHEILPLVPEDVLEVIDEGRNPDVWSRNRMGRLVSDNQQIAGQRWAIEEFRQYLTSSVAEVFPELAEEGPNEGEESILARMEREHQALRARLDIPEEARIQEGFAKNDPSDVEMTA